MDWETQFNVHVAQDVQHPICILINYIHDGLALLYDVQGTVPIDLSRNS